MRLSFMGTPAFALPSLQALFDAGHQICLVVTQRRTGIDTGLTVTGGAPLAGMQVALGFAGRPTDPRPAGHLATQGVAR